ncbi:MAG TPA: HesA/MoeB/ThiF family protein [Devosia sp.]|nr:HesA/MoeB/ThiF family protein [Devosia sp.]
MQGKEPELNSNEIARYARHIVLKGVGAPGQKKLKMARVLVVGAGGLGSPVIAYLSAAGVGHLSIVDDDKVDISNLQRQIVHATGDLGVDKSKSAAAFATNLNPDIHVQGTVARFDLSNGTEMIKDHDIVVDGSDRFSSRAEIAHLCEQNKTTLVSGAVSMFDGQVSVFAPHLRDENRQPFPRFSCLYPQTPDENDLPACEVNGILGATTGVIGTLMAMEVIKLITGVGRPLLGRLLLYDGRDAKFTELTYSSKN